MPKAVTFTSGLVLSILFAFMLPSSVFARLKAKKAPLDGTIHSSEILDAIPDDASPSEFSGCFSYLNEREHLWAKPRLPEWCKKLERNLVEKRVIEELDDATMERNAQILVVIHIMSFVVGIIVFGLCLYKTRVALFGRKNNNSSRNNRNRYRSDGGGVQDNNGVNEEQAGIEETHV